MVDIPSALAGASVQAGYQQGEVAKLRDAPKTSQVHAAKKEAQAIDDAGQIVGTSDEDVAVFSDSEGKGGQGRFSEEQSPEAHAGSGETGTHGPNELTDPSDARLDVRA